jgi:hypothetical protein
MGGDADAFRSAGDANCPRVTLLSDALQAFGGRARREGRHRLKAHEAAVERIGARVDGSDLGIARNAIAHLRSKLVDAGVDAIGADRVEEVERGLASATSWRSCAMPPKQTTSSPTAWT